MSFSRGRLINPKDRLHGFKSSLKRKFATRFGQAIIIILATVTISICHSNDILSSINISSPSMIDTLASLIDSENTSEYSTIDTNTAPPNVGLGEDVQVKSATPPYSSVELELPTDDKGDDNNAINSTGEEYQVKVTRSHAEDGMKMNTDADEGKDNADASDGSNDGVISIEESESRLEKVPSADDVNTVNTNAHASANSEAHEPEIDVKEVAKPKNKPLTSASDSPPAVVWLMSYPNSGTSFTMEMTETNSNTTVATNYHQEPIDLGFEPQSLYPTKNQKGSPLPPYILHTDGHLPSKYILTKTHCAGYCYGCLTRRWYQLDLNKFYDGCRSNSKERSHKQKYHSTDIVKKMIQIYRDPIDNAVSNFNLQHNDDMTSEEKKLYPKNRGGFRRFCNEKDAKYMNKNKQKFSTEDWNIFREIPCANSFYRYLQWHSNAIKLSRRMDLPVLHLFYEDYATDIHEIRRKLFDFLELKVVTDDAVFHTGKTYHDYYTKEEHVLIADMIKHFADKELRTILGRYVDL